MDRRLSDLRTDPSEFAGVKCPDIKSLLDADTKSLLSEVCPDVACTLGKASALTTPMEDWNNQAARPFTAEDSLMSDVLKEASLAPRHAGGRVSHLDIKRRISTQLTLGWAPRQVTAALDKLAEQVIFDRQMADEYLKDQSGLEGLAYIEPNHFNQSCVASLKHIQHHGKLKSASVKRIAACKGCTHCKPDHQGGCKCAAYGLPIVGNAQDLQRVVAGLTKGTAKKSHLVARHNGGEITTTPGHSVAVVAGRTEHETASKLAGHGTLTKFEPAALKLASSDFNPKVVKASIAGGKTLSNVYAEAKKAHGSHKTELVIKAYLNGLKHSNERINTAAVDCSLLRKRLTASETLIGKSKCASCSYRQQMHCGYTGGTLLSYPGLGTGGAKRASRKDPEAPDGNDIMAELGLTQDPEVTDMNWMEPEHQEPLEVTF